MRVCLFLKIRIRRSPQENEDYFDIPDVPQPPSAPQVDAGKNISTMGTAGRAALMCSAGSYFVHAAASSAKVPEANANQLTRPSSPGISYNDGTQIGGHADDTSEFERGGGMRVNVDTLLAKHSQSIANLRSRLGDGLFSKVLYMMSLMQ
jgi:hypothetical protein